MAGVFCLACGDSVPQQTERRRLLGDDSKSKRVYQAWKLICTAKTDLSSDEIQQIASDTTSPGIVCR